MKTAEFVKSFGLEFLEVSPGSKAGLSSRNTRWTGAGELKRVTASSRSTPSTISMAAARNWPICKTASLRMTDIRF